MTVEDIESSAIDGNKMIDENPDILKKVIPSTEIKEWLVGYVGKKHQPENGEVTIDMVLQAMAEEFPEFLLPVAEENFIRGYRQALQDAEEGRKLYEENLQKETDFENVEEDV